MVKYALDDAGEDDLMHNMVSLDSVDTSQSPDDTFEQHRSRKRRLRIPGAFDFAGPLEVASDPTVAVGPDFRVSGSQKAGRSTSSVDTTRETSSTVPDERLSERMSIASGAYDYQESIRGSNASDSNSEDREALTWPEQLANVTQRSRILDDSLSDQRNFIGFRERHARYTTTDLHRDLFGRTTGPGRQSEKPVCEMRAFRWCSGNTFAQTVSEGDGIRISTCGVSDKLDEAVSKLNIFMNHSIISVTPDSGPQASLRSSLSAQELAKVSSHAIAEVWALASTLFDELPPFGEDVSAEARLALTRRLRKEAVSHWLTRSISDETQRDQVKPLTNIERIFVCLTGNQVSAACTLALSIGDVRLATLLALGNTDSAARADIHAQLESWQVDQSVSCIDAARYLIYRLLAGGVSDLQSVVVGLSNVSNIEAILDNLDWRRRFGLCLWFGTHNQEGLDIAMHQYEDTWLSDASIMPSSNVSDALGCQFHLLRLFTARGHGLDAIADSVAWQESEWHSIEPWLMVEYLQARDAATLSDIRIDNLTIATSAQLETAGRYDFAIFVALFIKSPARQVFDNISYKLTTSRQSHILRLLAKLAPNLDASSEQFLQSRLQIPAAWIYQAKALQARYERRFLDEAHLLLSAGLADEAHQTLVREIGPECIVSGNLEPLVQILGGFTALETIQGWAEGGQVYQDAVSLALGGSQKSKAVIAAGVLDALPFMSTQTFLQKVAVSELMSLCMPISLSAKDKTRLQLPLASQAASFTAQAHLALQSSYSVKA